MLRYVLAQVIPETVWGMVWCEAGVREERPTLHWEMEMFVVAISVGYCGWREVELVALAQHVRTRKFFRQDYKRFMIAKRGVA